MGSLTQMLTEKELSLIVSLPANDIELARAAIAGGADAIKVHINVEHRASGNTFGTVEDNRAFFEQLKKEFAGPLGVVVGGSYEDVIPSEVKKMEDLGFSYFSIYMKDMPSFLLDSALEQTVAGQNDYKIETLAYLKETSVAAFEASIIKGTEYGQPLNFNDLLEYRTIVKTVGIPVIIPSQRKIEPKDTKALMDTGIKAVMIGAMSTGKDAASIERITREFRLEIDQLIKEAVNS